MNENVFNIPYVKLHFSLEMLEDTVLPASKASALRGGMGQMLLQQYCVRDRDCEKCPFQKDCVVWDTFYSRLEQTPDYVTGKESIGYLIECNDKATDFSEGESLEFRLTLFGSSIVFFSMYLQAFAYLGMAGLGKYRSKFRVAEVRNTAGECLVQNNEVDMGKYRIQSLENYVANRKRRLLSQTGGYRMRFRSPLSMKYQNAYLDSFAAEPLVLGAVRRVQMLDAYVGKKSDSPVFEQFPVITKQRVRQEATQRYSSTQESRIRLPGIIGSVEFESMPEDCLEYLIAGELTHIGKNTSFGFGEYRIQREDE